MIKNFSYNVSVAVTGNGKNTKELLDLFLFKFKNFKLSKDGTGLKVVFIKPAKASESINSEGKQLFLEGTSEPSAVGYRSRVQKRIKEL